MHFHALHEDYFSPPIKNYCQLYPHTNPLLFHFVNKYDDFLNKYHNHNKHHHDNSDYDHHDY
ncbi:hypothetical protein AsGV049 [Agrotis segetum granulovirus]|uniref:Uncharacterized protein n=1 Tax=Agrotis segetum granulosis virus TaxID=10464 RepID=A0A023MIE2_GVAS|nr:hypothetical protein AsGV049 [Agrotis segetum granulovirus]AHN92088.1 hypothetical protein AsGV049 [Agrotis segetum granulovirus]AKN63323.1 hypothetical protein AsGV049 [Agrotis segetum granulovirus]